LSIPHIRGVRYEWNLRFIKDSRVSTTFLVLGATVGTFVTWETATALGGGLD